MLIAARSSHDFACCSRATESARSKYACAFVASCSGDLSENSPARRLASASNHLSLVVSIAVIASPMQRQASSSWPSWAWAAAKCDSHDGKDHVAPVDRHAAIPELIAWTASEALPVRAKRRPRPNMPKAL